MSKREVKIPAIKPAKHNPKKPVTETAQGSPYGNPPPRGEQPKRFQTCPNCNGTGFRMENGVKIPCGLCRGSGQVFNPNAH